jgi:hypothetical protein
VQIRTVCLGDIHAPFHSRECIGWALDLIKHYKPRNVIQLGDSYDFYSASRFSKNNNKIKMTAFQEVQEARKVNEEIWRTVKKYSPKSKCYQLRGNHCERWNKQIESKLSELCGLISLDHLWKYRGVKTIYDVREELIVDGVIFMHGYKSRLGDHCRYNLANTACAHTHRGGTFFTQVKNKLIWELNAGHMCDPSTAGDYLKQKYSKWTQGIGVIFTNGAPAFIPFGSRI